MSQTLSQSMLNDCKCSVLGTPSVEDWDELESIPDWHIMPQFQPQILDTLFPAQQALDLLLVSIFLISSVFYEFIINSLSFMNFIMNIV